MILPRKGGRCQGAGPAGVLVLVMGMGTIMLYGLIGGDPILWALALGVLLVLCWERKGD